MNSTVRCLGTAVFLMLAVAGSLAPLSGQSYEHVIVTADSFVSRFAPGVCFAADRAGRVTRRVVVVR